MKTYEVKPEFWELWFIEEVKSYVITEEELNILALAWETPKEELLKQLIEIN